ncbi:MAG: maltose alpha-D-glucosyltransferase [Planctomycetota bacterium]|nr:maltose alpha-D-glucosyltransferase [Planctomycetota bacterium]
MADSAQSTPSNMGSRDSTEENASASEATVARWYQTAVIYQLHVRSFFDGTDDGNGDFIGLTQKLDYLQELGITAVWILPFYPSPLRDDGYDTADYTDVNPLYGTLRDFKIFLREAHRRGLRVITELVLNHTSDQHPWFQRARHAKPGSWQRDFYVWNDSPDKYRDARIIFKDFEASNWTWDPVAQSYFWHRFYSHQPDLNFENPKVKEALLNAVDHWLRLGVDGLRLDAVPYLYEKEGTNCENLPETHQFLKDLRAHIDSNFEDRMLLAEANQWPEDAVAYFGDGDECHAAFHFPVMPRLFMSVQMEDRFPIVDILQQTPAIPASSQWFTFLRNHDELTLEMVTDEERDYMYRVYANDRQARINLGIRRRLAPLLGNNRRKIELLNGLLFSLPGTPVIYYGDEIGMGDNIYLGDRNGVRTPMQWSSDRNGGFSRANPQRLCLPMIVDSEYLYEAINVETQRNNPQSLWWWMKRLIALRQRYPAFGRGDLEMLQPDNLKVLAFLRRDGDSTILVVANLSRFVQYVELDLSSYEGCRPVELFGQTKFPYISQLPYMLTLGPHAFYWFYFTCPGSAAPTATDQPNVITITEDWDDIFFGPKRNQVEVELTSWLLTRRWFSGKARDVRQLRVVDTVPIGKNHSPDAGKSRNSKQPRHIFVILRLEYSQGEGDFYALPLSCAWGEEAEQIAHAHKDSIAVHIVSKPLNRQGILFDAIQDSHFSADVLETMLVRRSTHGKQGELTGWTTRQGQLLRNQPKESLSGSFLGSDQSNSSVSYGEHAIAKIFRRIEIGQNPELEIGRQLAEDRCFANTPRLYGAIEYRRPEDPEAFTLAVMHEYIPNSVTAWKHTLDTVGRYLEECLANRADSTLPEAPSQTLLQLASAEIPGEIQDRLSSFMQSASLLGLRTAEMHLALAECVDDPAFKPEPFSQLYQRSMYQSLRKEVIQTMQLLRQVQKGLEVNLQEMAQTILSGQKPLLESLKTIAAQKLQAMRIRCHGDYHLGQVLYTGKDFVILDFEGEPGRSLADRKNKRSPFQDLAGMIRSFHYAAHQGYSKLVARGISTAEDAPFLGSAARLWAVWNSVSFLQAYLKRSEGAIFIPGRIADAEHLLSHYLIEKAVYELRYELNNRPDWVEVPMQGLLELMAGRH